MKNVVLATLLATAAFATLAEGNPHGMPPGIARKLQACDDCGFFQPGLDLSRIIADTSTFGQRKRGQR